MGAYYLVVKTIKRNRYYYYQTTWREGSKVKCHCIYVGPVNQIARPEPRAGRGEINKIRDRTVNLGRVLTPHEEWHRKMDQAQTPDKLRWLSYQYQQWKDGLASKSKASMNGGMDNKRAASELFRLSGFHENQWYEYAKGHDINLNDYLKHAASLHGRERDAYLNTLVDIITGYNVGTFPPLASTSKTSMNGGMNRRKILGIPDGLHFCSLADEIAHEHKKLYRHMFGLAKDCPDYPAFMERLHQDGLLTSRTEITSFVRYCTGNRKLTDEEAGKMLETLFLGMTVALPPDKEEYPGDPAAEGNMALRLNHLQELQSQASHPGAVTAKKIGRFMPDITAAEERKVLKSIAEKGYYEQPLEQKQAFCKKTGGHRDFIIGEQKEIDGQLRTEYKCGWCGTIEYR